MPICQTVYYILWGSWRMRGRGTSIWSQYHRDFPVPSGKECACHCRRCVFHPWSRKILWRRKRQPTPVLLPGEPQGQRRLECHSPQGRRVRWNWTSTHARGITVRLWTNKSVEVLVAQERPALCDPRDCSLPGFSVHRTFQARILEWVASPFFRGLSQPRDRTCVSFTAGRFFTIWAIGFLNYSVVFYKSCELSRFSPCTCAPACVLSCIWFFETPWTVACQASLSMEFSGKNTRADCHFLLQGIFPTQGLKPSPMCLLHWLVDSLPLSKLGSPLSLHWTQKSLEPNFWYVQFIGFLDRDS